MIRKDSGRSKFISLLIVMTMVFSMIMPMGAWAVGSELAHDVSGNTHTFASLKENYTSVVKLDVNINTTTGSQTNVMVNLTGTNADSFELEFNGVVTTTAAIDTLTTTPAQFKVMPKSGLAIGTYTATVKITSDQEQYPNGISFTVTQAVVPAYATNHVGSINTPNVLLIGEYAFTLSTTNANYDLNNFIKGAKTAYANPADNYHVYLHVGNGVWFDLVTDQTLTTPITDLDTINGDGLFTYLDGVNKTPPA